jgi:Family of unknown function (DUF6174)
MKLEWTWIYMRLAIVISAGLVMFLGLNTPVMPQSPIQVAPSSELTDLSSQRLQQLRIFRQLWRHQKIYSYRYTLSNSCFCITEARGPVVIEVRDGRTTSITSAQTGEPVNPDFFRKYNTIPRLFNLIRHAIAGGASNLTVQYDQQLGYPTQINIDYDSQIADEEVFLTIENLQEIP